MLESRLRILGVLLVVLVRKPCLCQMLLLFCFIGLACDSEKPLDGDDWTICSKLELKELDILAYALLNDYSFERPLIIPY